MTEHNVLPPPGVHTCDLPPRDDDNDRPLLTLAQCPVCWHWWFWDWDPGGDIAGWPYKTWRQVRWYHILLRGRIPR